jgi:hypothetical protein
MAARTKRLSETLGALAVFQPLETLRKAIAARKKRKHGRRSSHDGALGLVIMEPWITKIFAGEKLWELRRGPTNVRGRIALIRSGSGLIIGTVRVVDCIKLNATDIRRNVKKHGVPAHSALAYAKDGVLYAWVFAEPKLFRTPRPYKHPSGAVIWVNLPKGALQAT